MMVSPLLYIEPIKVVRVLEKPATGLEIGSFDGSFT
jgi:hypothetical protein